MRQCDVYSGVHAAVLRVMLPLTLRRLRLLLGIRVSSHRSCAPYVHHLSFYALSSLISQRPRLPDQEPLIAHTCRDQGSEARNIHDRYRRARLLATCIERGADSGPKSRVHQGRWSIPRRQHTLPHDSCIDLLMRRAGVHSVHTHNRRQASRHELTPSVLSIILPACRSYSRCCTSRIGRKL